MDPTTAKERIKAALAMYEAKRQSSTGHRPAWGKRSKRAPSKPGGSDRKPADRQESGTLEGVWTEA